MMLGQKIKKVRELKGFPPKQIFEAIGVSQSEYSKIENGLIDLPYSRIEQIAKALEVKPEDIISLNENVVFNVTHNITGITNGMVVNHSSPEEKKLYEEQTQILKDVIILLKSIIDKLMISSIKE